jgi:ferredoxin
MTTPRHATVRIDRKVCQGTGYCEQLLPQVFRVGPEGQADVLREVANDEELELAREAEDICPTRAILLEAAKDGG